MKPTICFDCEHIRANFGKISNNVIKQIDETEFTIPVSGLMLDPKKLCDVLGCPEVWTIWFTKDEKGFVQVAPWWELSDGEFKIGESYLAKSLIIRFNEHQWIEFIEEESDDDEKGEPIPACKLANIRFRPGLNGFTELKFSLHVRPGRGDENLLLQQNQYSAVQLSFSGTRVIQEEPKQTEMPFHPAPVGGLPDHMIQRDDQTVDAVESKPEEAVVSAPSNTPACAQGADAPNAETPDTGASPAVSGTSQEPDSEAVSQASEETRRMQARAKAASEATDLKDFERRMQQELEKRDDRPPNVIDGTARFG